MIFFCWKISDCFDVELFDVVRESLSMLQILSNWLFENNVDALCKALWLIDWFDLALHRKYDFVNDCVRREKDSLTLVTLDFIDR